MRKRHPLPPAFFFLNPLITNSLSSSSMAMPFSNSKLLSYQRLKHDSFVREKVSGRERSSRFRRVHLRRRFRLKIPNLKRFFTRNVTIATTAWKKVRRRLVESRSHFGDLFAGNYLFMQVTPTPLKYAANHGGKPFFVKAIPTATKISRF